MVERVANAIANAPRVFLRQNKAHPLPYEVCLDAKPDEPIDDGSFNVLSRWGFLAEAEAETAFWRKFHRARAAVAAMREPDGYMVSAGCRVNPTEGSIQEVVEIWRAMIDTALAKPQTVTIPVTKP